MKKLAYAITSAAFALGPSVGQAELLVVGVEDIQYLPHYQWDGKTYTGFGAELLSKFAEDEGYEIEFQALPVSRLMRAVVNGDVDLKYPDNAYWSSDLKSDAGVVYSQTVVEAIDGVMVLPDHKNRPVEELEKLGTVLGFTPYTWLDRIETGDVALSENKSFESLIRQVIAGRTDGAYANLDVFTYALGEMGETADALVFDDSLPHSVSSYHLSTSTRADVVSKFDTWLIENAELVAELKGKHGL